MKPTLAGAVAALVSVLVAAQGPDVLENAARSMGAAGLQSIRYSGRGSVYLLGQAPAPGAPWPRFELAKYVASVDYGRNAMREEQVRRDVERPPRGGGAGPFNPATGQGGIRPIPGDVSQNTVRDGRTEPGLIQIALTPHGFLKVAAANKASVTTSTARGRTNHAISFSIGRHVLTGTIDDRGLVERVETRIPNPVLGDMLVEAIFADYRDHGGVQFPSRITQRQGGHAVLDLVVLDVQPNGAAAGPVNSPAPPAAATAAPPGGAPAEKIADGVWFLTGGNPMSVLVEFSDHVVVIEAPQGESRSEATIAAVKTLLPSKPIRYVVNTHHHFDHAGGIRGFVAAGIPVVTHQANKPYFERIFKNPFTLEPDRLARAPRPAVIETVADKRVFADAAMTLELHHLRGFLHDEAMLVAYLPKQKLLVQADAFHPRPGAAPLASPSPFTVSLIDNIRRLKLDVERVVHVHGGADPLAAVVKAAGG